METLFGGLALAAITAVSMIAYRHPKGYAKLFKALSSIIIVSFIAVAGFAVGVDNAHLVLKPYLSPAKANEAAKAIAGITPDPTLTALFAMIIFAFFAFLLYLPELLENHDDDSIKP